MFNLHRLPIIYPLWKWHRTCLRKVKHRSMAAAEREASRLGKGVHAYKCPYCRKWHTGHETKRRR